MAKTRINQHQDAPTLLGMAERTTSMSGFSAETTMVSVTVDVPTTSRKIMIMCMIPETKSTVTTDRFTVRLKEGSTTIQQTYASPYSYGWSGTVFKIKAAPTAGSVTYTATIQRDVGTGTLSLWSENTSTIQIVVMLV